MRQTTAAASSFFRLRPSVIRKTPIKRPAVRQRPVLPVSASRANCGVIAAQGAPSAPAPPHTRPAPAAHAASSDPDDSGRVERLPLHARTDQAGQRFHEVAAVFPLSRTHVLGRELFKLRLFHGPEPLCRRAPAPPPKKKRPRSQTRALLMLRASVRCRKNREGFSESGRGPPSTNVFRRCGGTPHVGRSPAPWKMFFHRGRTDRSSNAV